jgi:hypothetical protein
LVLAEAKKFLVHFWLKNGTQAFEEFSNFYWKSKDVTNSQAMQTSAKFPRGSSISNVTKIARVCPGQWPLRSVPRGTNDNCTPEFKHSRRGNIISKREHEFKSSTVCGYASQEKRN